MQGESTSEKAQEVSFLSKSPGHRLLIVGLLFLTAFCIRLYHIDRIDFNPIREYRSALIARCYYFMATESIPEWRKQVASINRREMSILEPPIMEVFASIGYKILGGEHLWIPRLLASLFWVVGGVFLYLMARGITSEDGALCSTAVYLFLPYGAYASRGFTPDSLMIMTLLISLFTTLRYYEKPAVARLLISASVSALSGFVKPIALFLIFGAFISLAIWRQGLRRSVVDRNLLIFVVVSLLPAGIFYAYYGIFSSGTLLSYYAQTSFIPRLFLQPIFWAGWIYQIHLVIGFPALVGGLLGVLLFWQGLPRVLLMGLWGGYLSMGFAVNYRIHTHENYQLPLVPIVALSLGPIFVLLVGYLRQRLTRQSAGLSMFLLCVFLGIVSTGITLCRPYYFDLKWLEDEVRVAEEIGQRLGHSTQTIFLAGVWGESLLYHGEIAGTAWPHSSEFRAHQLMGRSEMSVEERFNAIKMRFSPEFFIVTDFRDFRKQPDLREFLASGFHTMVQNNDYLIFDLRQRLDLNRQPEKR